MRHPTQRPSQRLALKNNKMNANKQDMEQEHGSRSQVRQETAMQAITKKEGR